MRLRGVTVLVGAIITALLTVGIMTTPVPYVILGAGPTVDTLGTDKGQPVITITGTSTSSSAGQLRLTTVGVDPSTDLISAIRAWIDDDEAVVPRELIYPPDQTEEQVEQRNAEDFQQSQSSAETAALRTLGYPVQVVVKNVLADSPARGVLRNGDVITAVDGQPVTTAPGLTEMIRAKPAGSARAIAYTRNGQPATVTITTAGDPPRVGVEIESRQPHPFELAIQLDEIGGPSAGLMFALGIVDKLKPEDLTGGTIIAGTGTIDDEGRVGPIGGIPQKLVGAKAAGAKVFLVPAGNCAEAVANAQPGLPLIKVASLDEALAALATLRSGGQPTLCGPR